MLENMKNLHFRRFLANKRPPNILRACNLNSDLLTKWMVRSHRIKLLNKGIKTVWRKGSTCLTVLTQLQMNLHNKQCNYELESQITGHLLEDATYAHVCQHSERMSLEVSQNRVHAGRWITERKIKYCLIKNMKI